MSETRIYLVRHGQTLWNLERRFQGHLDSPLTRTGEEQARKTGELLSNTPIDHVYASPLPRTQATARIVLRGRPSNITLESGLKEINLGPLEGVFYEDALASHPVAAIDFWEAPHRFKLDGAETTLDVQTRMVDALMKIAQAHPGKSTLVVSHGMAIMTAMAHFMEIPLTRLKEIPLPKNGSITTLSSNGSGHWGISPFHPNA